MEIKVECYSSGEYADRPVALWWEEERLPVAQVLAEARLPAAKRFTLRTADGQRWVIEYRFDREQWQLIESSAG